MPFDNIAIKRTINEKLLWLIAITVVIKCIVAASIELGNDEVYYLSYARYLQWNYFDHPPLVALLIRITTFNLFSQQELLVRLGPILLAAINTWMVFKIAAKIKNESAGIITALLFTASPYCSIIAGTFILPDAPQLFFWIASIYLLIDIVTNADFNTKINYKLILFGVLAGLCIMSKVHGVFLWVGFGLYILMYQRSFLKNPFLYVAIIITAIIISPILLWNIQNNFITYNFHSDRVTINQGLHPLGFFKEIIGGMLYNNPINFVLILVAIFSISKSNTFITIQMQRLLLLLSLPLIIIILLVSMFRDTLPHWSGPAYVALLIYTGCYIAYRFQTQPLFGKKLYRSAVAGVLLMLFIVFIGLPFIKYLPATIGKKEQNLLGEYDFTLDMFGWKDAKNKFEKLYLANQKNGITTTTFIINNKWFPGAHIDNYIAQPLHLNFIAIGSLNDIHTYAWLNQYRKKLQPGDDAYYITVSNYFSDPIEKYGASFQNISAPVILPQLRAGVPVKNLYVYLLKNYLGK